MIAFTRVNDKLVIVFKKEKIHEKNLSELQYANNKK